MSHETLYRSLFVQARGALKEELQQFLRIQRAIRRSKHVSLKRDGLVQIKNAVSIRERPASVEDQTVPVHWKGNLIAGSNNNFIATLGDDVCRSCHRTFDEFTHWVEMKEREWRSVNRRITLEFWEQSEG